MQVQRATQTTGTNNTEGTATTTAMITGAVHTHPLPLGVLGDAKLLPDLLASVQLVTVTTIWVQLSAQEGGRVGEDLPHEAGSKSREDLVRWPVRRTPVAHLHVSRHASTAASYKYTLYVPPTAVGICTFNTATAGRTIIALVTDLGRLNGY